MKTTSAKISRAISNDTLHMAILCAVFVAALAWAIAGFYLAAFALVIFLGILVGACLGSVKIATGFFVAMVAFTVITLSSLAPAYAADTSLRSACDGDERYPDINYSHPLLSQICDKDGAVSGYWFVDSHIDPDSGSVSVAAVNFSQLPLTSGDEHNEFIALTCNNGTELGAQIFLSTPIGFTFDEFIRVGYRVDESESIYSRWSAPRPNTVVTDGDQSRAFMLDIYNASKLRLWVYGQTRIDFRSDLSGSYGAVKSVADACGWTDIAFTNDESAEHIAEAAARSASGDAGAAARAAYRDRLLKQAQALLVPFTDAVDAALSILIQPVVADERFSKVADDIRAHVSRCWVPAPVGTAADLVVDIAVSVGPEGVVTEAYPWIDPDNHSNRLFNVDTGYRAAVRAAIRSLQKCSPLPIPSDMQPHFRNFIMEFDPRFLSSAGR